MRSGAIVGSIVEIARRAWNALEPIHSLIYFVPERTDAYNSLGLEPISHYFASRAAAMGTVPAGVVTAVFYHFSPGLVARAMRDVWNVTTPEAIVAIRYRVVEESLRRCVDRIDPDDLHQSLAVALPIAREAASVLDPAGRPLYAGHAHVAEQDEPLVGLWHNLTLLREHRGDGHVAALQAHGFEPIPALVTADGYSKIPVRALQRMRGWRDDAWAEGVESARRIGWIDSDGSRTAKGTEAREAMETTTNQLAAVPWRHIGEDRTGELINALEPIRTAVINAGAIPDAK